jgi:transcriptional regulator with XRE-family HTH domain
VSAKKSNSSSGIAHLDQLLSGLFVGDNVIWYDTAGSLAAVFYLNFIRESLAHKKPLIYVCFDRSPRNLLEKLGPLAANKQLTILDCFTHGKGAGAEIFRNFYRQKAPKRRCRVIRVAQPRKMDQVMDAFYGIHGTMEGSVHFVFESLTGMQEIWEGEEQLLNFYSHSCPRLYELNTIAYWVIEKEAHSSRLKAQINQIAQVAIDLSVKRGKTSLTILKAEKREPENLNRPHFYWSKDLNVAFESEAANFSKIDLGTRLKKLRTQQGISQTALAKQVGVTPSTISQVESNLIYPSLPALLKMAEILSVKAGSFFSESVDAPAQTVFEAAEATEICFPNLPKNSLEAKRLFPMDFESTAEPFLIEIPPQKTIASHFFFHKGEEIGFILSGKLQVKLHETNRTLKAGDILCLKADIPSQWKNPGKSPARLLWIKINK